MNEAIRMQLSAFADGELPDNEKELLLRRLSQDAEMRRQVAEYLSIGRAIRGEVPVQGIDGLRDRIADAIGRIDANDTGEPVADSAAIETGERSMLRPVLGFAVAASVALIAIFGLRQLTEVEGVAVEQPRVADTETVFPTQQPIDNVLQQYRLLHDAEAADSSMRARFTSIELRQGLVTTDDADQRLSETESAPAADAELQSPDENDEPRVAEPE
ncbi:MAG TPA: RseA family anti-sigma factor [Woeseiaceae bacterium]|nr:RseA family anti-sigma factor [Woeseiaceae bacterium]